MKHGKYQRSTQRCQDLCWKVHDPAQSFVLRSYTMHELRSQRSSPSAETILILISGEQTKLILC